MLVNNNPDNLTKQQKLVVGSDLYYCTNCGTFSPLNKHGRCSTCDSDSVIPIANYEEDAFRDLRPCMHTSTPAALAHQICVRQSDESVMQWAARFIKLYIG